MKHITALIMTCLLLLPAHGQPGLTDAQCRQVCWHIQQVYDQYPDSDIVRKTIERNLPLLRGQKDLTYYFTACNTYIDWLFRHGDLTTSHQEIKRIIEMAGTTAQPELLAIARRAEGQFMMRFGFNDRARELFEDALRVCPDYHRLKEPYTYITIVLQLSKVYMRLGHANHADRMLRILDGILQERDHLRQPDPRNWLHARVAALHAGLEMLRGNHTLCAEWMERSRRYMLPGVPARYYASYYIMRNHVYLQRKQYAEALAGTDTLLNLGFDILPLRPDFLHQRAVALKHLGRGTEAAEAYEAYIAENNHSDALIQTTRIELMRDRFRIEQAQAEQAHAEHDRNMLFIVCGILLSAAAVMGGLWWRLRRQNRRLVAVLRAADKLDRTPSGTNETGTQVLKDTRAFCDVDGGRAALAAHLGMSERTAVAAVAAVAGTSFKSYTNTLKLRESRRLLESDPLMPVATVAATCGFGTVRTYQALFKEQYGISPTRYRETLDETDSEPEDGTED